MKNRYWEVGYHKEADQFLLIRHNKVGRWVETISLELEELLALQSYLAEYKVIKKPKDKNK